ncbi:MAG TPA: hypothetical protein VGE01_04660 [Fimbriimonas sp.]
MTTIVIERIVVRGLPRLDAAALERGLQAALGTRASARPARTQEERLAEKVALAISAALESQRWGGPDVE